MKSLKKGVDMVRTAWYPLNMSIALENVTHGQLKDVSKQLEVTAVKSKRREPRKTKEVKENAMTPTQSNGQETKRVYKSVFDLALFDDQQLGKEVLMPKRPENVDEALALLNNDKQKLLDVIYEGLCADAVETAKSQMEGFKVVDEETGDLGEDYQGKYADEDKGKLINAAVLSLAKIQGFDKNKTKEEKRALKNKAKEFLRNNPAMIESLQG